MKKYSGKYVFVMFAQMFALFRMAELIKQSSSKVLPAVLEPVGSKKIQTRAHKLGIWNYCQTRLVQYSSVEHHTLIIFQCSVPVFQVDTLHRTAPISCMFSDLMLSAAG